LFIIESLKKYEIIKTYIIIAFVLLFGPLHSQTMNVSIDLKLKGAPEGLKVYLCDFDAENQTIDSAYFKNETLQFRLNYSTQFFGFITFENFNDPLNPMGVFTLFVDSVPIYVEDNFSNFNKIRMKDVGNNKILRFVYILNDSLEKVSQSLEKASQSLKNLSFNDKMNYYKSKFTKEYEASVIEFIRNNPNDFASLYSMGSLIDKFNKDTIRNIYHKLSEVNQNSKYGKKVLAYLNLDTTSIINKPFIEIIGENINGELVKLSDYKGQVILLNFTGSNCFACILQKKFLRSLNSDYQNQDFKIISFLLDTRKESFNQYLKDNTWINFTDFKGYYSNAAISYVINSIPILFLINKEGKIIMKINGHQTGEGAYEELINKIQTELSK
jgi:peroxiredoxin